MSDRIAFKNLDHAKHPDSAYGTKIIKPELLDDVVAEFKNADPESGKPAGVFSQAALDALIALQGAERAALSGSVRRLLPGIIDEARANLWNRVDPGPDPVEDRVVDIRPKNGHAVHLTTQNGFAVDAAGRPPAGVQQLSNALYHAGEWVQASFGSRDNLFDKSDVAGKRAVVEQLGAQLQGDLGELSTKQLDQLIGNIAGLTVELMKSVDIDVRAPAPRPADRQLLDDAFALLNQTLEDNRLSPLIKRQLVGYLHESRSFRAALTTPQKKSIDAKHAELNPEKPFDYDAWDAAGKDVIRIDHVAGLGEGFLYGITKWLTEKGLGDANWREGQNRFEIVEGHNEDDHTPRMLRVTVPANDPLNEWRRDMTVEIELSAFSNNMLRGLGREDIDITGYDGHSGFGRNTLRSMDNAPKQKGDKLFYRFVCAGVDAENAIAHHAPEAFSNSYTTQDSGYFRKRDGGPNGGEYAYEAEGWQALRCMIRGVLQKKTHAEIQSDMQRRANWGGHSAGNENNFVGPGDKRRGGSGDWDNDGIPNMYDVMPSANLFDVEASVRNEFDLKVPDTPADQISGNRAFQAIQFVDTATNYTTLLDRFNLNRAINANPEGIWFDGAEDPNTYVRFEKNDDGKVLVQFNSALSDMTMETLRAVLYYETSNYLLSENRQWDVQDHPSRVAANLLFAAASLEYDMSYRDQAVFDGLKSLYNIPDEVRFGDFRSAIFEAEERHNYCGDGPSLRKVVDRYRDQLAPEEVGKPSVPAYV